ncbi:MAG: nucleotidyltransferase family protein [Candidatus Aenigmatarchaeota archaeon]
MKVIILAGGFGQRLKPISEFLPKTLLPVNGKPLLDYIIYKIEEIEDIDEIIISTNKYFENHFNYWIEKYNGNKKILLVVEPSLKEEEKLGAIGGLNYALKTLNIEDDILVIASDNFLDVNLKDMVYLFKKERKIIIGVYEIIKDDPSRFGIVLMQNNVIIDFQEKPKEPKSRLVSTGCYIIPKEKIKLIEDYINSKMNPDALGYFFEWIVKKETVLGFKFDGIWFDIGTVDAYKELDRLVRGGLIKHI